MFFLRICLLLLALVPLGGQAQSYLDRLQAHLDSAQAERVDSSRLRQVFKAAEVAFDAADYALTDSLVSSVMAEAARQGPKMEAEASFWKGSALYRQREFDSADHHLARAEAYYENQDRPYRLVKVRNSRGLIRLYSGRYDEATDKLLQALKVAETLDDPELVASFYSNLGWVNYRAGLYEAARDYSLQALAIHRETGDSTGIAQITQNLGAIYADQDSLAQSLVYLQEALNMWQRLGNDFKVAWGYSNLGGIYNYLEQYEEADQAFRTSIERFKTIDDPQGEASVLYNFGTNLGDRGLYAEGLPYLERALQLATEVEYFDVRYKALDALAVHQYHTGRYREAYLNRSLVEQLKDSLKGAYLQDRVTELQTQYETEKKEQQLEVQALELANQRQRNQRNLILAGAIGLIGLLAGIAIYLRLQQRRRFEARLKDLELKAEKERISRDLHDHVGAQLTAITTKLNLLGQQAGQQSEGLEVASLEKLDEHARETMGLLRDTIWAIKQEEIDLTGLEKKLQHYLFRYLEGMERPTWSVKAHGTYTLSPHQALTLFRILQEGIQNAVKHAEAEQLLIRLNSDDHGLSVSLQDDGKGFDLSDQVLEGHYGLQNMQARAEEIGARLSWKSATGKGTQLTVVLPGA
ncbi:MAG: hypothetical protein D6722_28000 [Bacteroidetes bacterium]|nr:MAG: hypothetical protein D6722_28000 [Bacteroidota bacterium]